ncbi:hypothetical protein DSC47_09965 [Elizabethkingia miricola]|uniref:AbiH family protein n=1 Tax=Elizabethkingia bruuniana TaxID=1756149 RepID=UPI000999FFA8|nr:AbiH family protein [Elizabethkingia bruuniana]OPC66387.1 hypothetical protein BAY13_16750 [Elizabethkingia bruuniana]RBI91615.1 hypothetical protein DSC47_09965 [Elizabethkingia miricola]
MNRIILIGNGFDLAHGFKTRYIDFLDYIWKQFNERHEEELFSDLLNLKPGHIIFNNKVVDINSLKEEIKRLCSVPRSMYKTPVQSPNKTRICLLHGGNIVFEFKNLFFEYISNKRITNWVDIENCYYKTLISILKNDNNKSGIKTIEKLNEDFELIKKLLQLYLTEEVERKFNINDHYIKNTEIFRLFGYEFKNLQKIKSHKYYLEFNKSDYRTLLEFDNKFHPDEIHKQGIACFENVFLDFNYTSTVSEYVKALNKAHYSVFGDNYHIKIHGDVFDSSGENPINFGFGDEMDEKYKMIENENDNNYLQNIKSFMYLNNSNYRKLLNWINEKEFQVFVMGHSCGLSDRTMLNTIFEHHNCRSIKVFYHAYNGKDNFRDTIQNISRCFNKKALMREKVVDKGLSEPLPQEVRFPLRKGTS